MEINPDRVSKFIEQWFAESLAHSSDDAPQRSNWRTLRQEAEQLQKKVQGLSNCGYDIGSQKWFEQLALTAQASLPKQKPRWWIHEVSY
jgi:hypothetical protein